MDNNAANLADTPLYFTSVSKDAGKISGYRINTKTLTSDSIWTISLGNQNKIIDIKTQYETQYAASDPKYILPTSFGQDGQLFYKYLDSNMFYVISSEINDPSTITVYLINGVTGRIVYQFQEQNVSSSEAHTIASLFSEQYFVLSFMR